MRKKMKRLKGFLGLPSKIASLISSVAGLESRVSEMGAELTQCSGKAADPILQITRVRNVVHSSSEASPSSFVIPPDKMLKVELYDGSTTEVCLSEAGSKDKFSIPATIDREGYFGDNHMGFWESGLVDYVKLEHVRSRFFGDCPVTLLDLGCATGRFLRHPAAQGVG